VARKTTDELKQAFRSDGYDVSRLVEYQGARGLLAEHSTAKTRDPRNPGPGAAKRAYYVEGNGYQMGYLMGLMAEPQVQRMTWDFTNAVTPSFVSPDLSGLSRNVVIQILVEIVRSYCQVIYAAHPNDIPRQLLDEMRGIADGCRAANPSTPVTYERVLALNAGQDCLVAVAYTGLGLYDHVEKILSRLGGVFSFLSRFSWLVPLAKSLLPKLKPEFFRVPLACNAFAAFGNATRDHKCYFGRDFQFPAAGVLQDTACMVIYNPDYQVDGGRPALPLVSVSAPGFAGAITSMNAAGVGIGVDMAPSGNCDPARPGLNSLLMVRHAGHCGYGAQGAVDAMVAAQRGASWMYPVGDGPNSRAAVVESGKTVEALDFLGYPPPDLRPLLPAGPFDPARRGLMVRWNDWQYPARYHQFNKALFQKMGYVWDEANFGERGYLNPSWHGGPVDQVFFFAPQREMKNDLMVVTNHFIIPEMRLCAMYEWSNAVARAKACDILWRYDELNRQCLEAYGTIDEAVARRLIDFLSPAGPFKDYYGDNPVIEGSVSLCNLTDRVIDSHFGYQPDPWVRLTLPRYV